MFLLKKPTTGILHSFSEIAAVLKKHFNDSQPLHTKRKHWNKSSLEALSKDEVVEELLKCQNNLATMEKQLMKRVGLNLNTRRKAKEVDFLQCNYRHIAIKLVYNGLMYEGLQNHPHSSNSIESVLIAALQQCRLVSPDLPVRFIRAGRTDKEVSSFGQVLSFLVRTKHDEGQHVVKWFDHLEMKRKSEITTDSADSTSLQECDVTKLGNVLSEDGCTGCESSHVNEQSGSSDSDEDRVSGTPYYEYNYLRMLNSVLPPEIRVIDWAPVGKSFSARYDCRKRTYHYYFWRQHLDVDKMSEAASMLCGVHDFRNFCSLSKKPTMFLRKILDFKFVKCHEDINTGEIYCAKIKGVSFLYHQVRLMMTILFLIGQGKEDKEIITRLLDVEQNPRRPAYVASEAYPLVLYETEIEKINWVSKRKDVMRSVRFVQMQWEKMVLQTVMFKDLTLKLKKQRCQDSETNLIHDEKSSSEVESSNKDFPCTLSSKMMHQACSMNVKEYVPVLERRTYQSPEDKFPGWDGNRISKRWLENED